MLVDLVGDDEGVVLLCEVGNYQQLLTREHLAAWIRRVAEYERLGVLLESGFEHVRVEAEFGRIERHVYRLCAREYRISAVILVKRREHDDLVARIRHGHHRRHHSLGASAGDDYLAVGVDRTSHEAGLLLGECLAEVLRSPCNGILVEVLACDLGEAVEYLARGLEVGEALREVDRAVFIGNTRHTAYDGIGKGSCAVGKLRHIFSPYYHN